MKKELNNMSNQLKNYNMGKTEKKIDITFLDKHIGKMAIEINNLIDLHAMSNIEKKSAERELKQAVANMSHDLRTPLTSILGYIQLMEKPEVTEEEKKEYLTIAKDRTRRLQILLNDFFELSLIESVDHSLKLEKLKMNNIVEEIVMNLYDRFNEQQIVPSIKIPQEKINIIGDESAIKRVIENLLTNAIRYSDGNIAIILEKNNKNISLTISNGVKDLTEKDVELFFDRFYTADQTRSGKGTGLGLSIAKGLMEKMNGKLSAELKDGWLYMKCSWLLTD
ncbi:HAMP domain-containing histidine kinase [Terrisporobacter petrolearius]|uniref:sensor histidine kinase n=1 Tax=Terrisporobacter petrolearius TaxID=1460447 RepID=UPI001D162D7A|nr:HAMP domain-containing sensor histidine kinase [Terrisporobacter petrolearius]MCC3863754.1 HAMP domain-containing histidine kinase [Terrisporobacter petrolearius]